MKKLAYFYHCRLSGGEPHIDFEHASGIMAEQMADLKSSGLEDACDYIYIGVNGGPSDYAAACMLAPEKAVCVEYPGHFRGEHPTLHAMQKWLLDHQDWYVCYAHSKGAIHKGEPLYDLWRQRMQFATVTQWKECVEDMDKGADAVGCHWLTPQQYPAAVTAPFFGGNFWWCTAKFLLTLPMIEETAVTRQDFYRAEMLIGLGPRYPRIVDKYPGWP